MGNFLVPPKYVMNFFHSRKEFFNGDTLFFLYVAQLLLLLTIGVGFGVCFGYNVKSVGSAVQQVYDVETDSLLSSCIFMLSSMPLHFGSEDAALSANGEFVLLIDRIENRERVTIDFDQLRAKITTIFEKGSEEDVGNQLAALEATQEAISMLLAAKSNLFSSELSGAYGHLMATWCFAREVYEVYFSIALLQSTVFPSVQGDNYRHYSGLVKLLHSGASCSQYSTFKPDVDFSVIVKGAPSLSASPDFSFLYSASPLSKEDVNEAMLLLKSQWEDLDTEITDFWKLGSYHVLLTTIFSIIAMVLSFLFLFLSPLFFSLGFQGDYEAVCRHNDAEGKVKILNFYSSSITGLKEDSRLYFILEGSFLSKLVGFIRRARPFVPQTAFGDIESLLVSGGDDLFSAGGREFIEATATSTYDEEDDQASLELRTDVGMNTVEGTIMCVQTQWRSSSVERNVQHMDSICTTKNAVLSMVERIATTHRGVIHSVADYCTYAAWNITSSCRTHELYALRAAMQILHMLEHSEVTISISISSSLLMAGTVGESLQRVPMICGPAMLFCQKTHQLHRYHSTAIYMDKRVAAKVLNLGSSREDYCAVPISLCKMNLDDTEYQLVYGLFDSPRTEPLKVWSNIMKSFRTMLVNSEFEQMLTILNEYQKRFSSSGENNEALLLKTLQFWMDLLQSLISKQREKQ